MLTLIYTFAECHSLYSTQNRMEIKYGNLLILTVGECDVAGPRCPLTAGSDITQICTFVTGTITTAVALQQKILI